MYVDVQRFRRARLSLRLLYYSHVALQIFIKICHFSTYLRVLAIAITCRRNQPRRQSIILPPAAPPASRSCRGLPPDGRPTTARPTAARRPPGDDARAAPRRPLPPPSPAAPALSAAGPAARWPNSPRRRRARCGHDSARGTTVPRPSSTASQRPSSPGAAPRAFCWQSLLLPGLPP